MTEPYSTPDSQRSLLRLLNVLRWLAVGGQAITVLVVTGPMQIGVPTPPLWAGIALLGVFNVYASVRMRANAGIGAAEVFFHMLVDIVVLAWLVGWSGGIENPFSSLFLMPIALSILVLPARWVWATAIAAACGYAASALWGQPLPHVHGVMGDAFSVHKLGMLVNFFVSAAVMLGFFARMAAAWRRREREVAQLRERFTRNEGIVALATHAASVAHELNTPLGTLTFMVDDLLHDSGTGRQREDFTTMKALLELCRDRVRELASPAHSRSGNGLNDRVTLQQVVDRWQLVRPTIELMHTGTATGQEQVDATVGYLLQVLLNNAADASEQAGRAVVELRLDVAGHSLEGEIVDHGQGFGTTEPVLPATLFRTSKPDGLGIGLALSHATVEQLGGELSMQARAEGRGARVMFRLPDAVKP